MIRKFFSPPVFDNEDDNFRAKFINGFAWIVSLLLIISLIPYVTSPAIDYTAYVLTGLIAIMFISLYLLRNGSINSSGLIIVILGWLSLTFQAYTIASTQR